MACEQSADFHESLDPFAPAAFNVSWAGEETSLNRFDIARIDRTLASPAADSTGDKPDRIYDARAISPGTRLLRARATAHLSRRQRAGRNSNWPRDFRRLWRPMVSVEGIGPMGTVEPIERSGRVASDDTAPIGVARFHQGH
jgi:hypothetical protein